MSQASSTSIERFIERENIALFQRRMAEEADENRRRLLTISSHRGTGASRCDRGAGIRGASRADG